MATYEEIVKANKTIKTTDIKGKEYAEVPQRIKAFRMVYPNGFIKTEIVSNENGVCIIKATVGVYEALVMSDETKSRIEERILGTGTAYEKEDSTFINKTSYIENCETSAVGRALGMAGFGIDTSVASAEEVQNAMANQEQKAITSQPQRKNIEAPAPPKDAEADVKPEAEMTKPDDVITPLHVDAVRKRIKAAAEKGKVLLEEDICKMLKIPNLESMNFGQLGWFVKMMEKNGV